MTITEAASTTIKSGKNTGTKVGYLNRMQLDWYGDKEYRSGLRNPWNIAAHIIRDAQICASIYGRGYKGTIHNQSEYQASQEWFAWLAANTQEEDW